MQRHQYSLIFRFNSAPRTGCSGIALALPTFTVRFVVYVTLDFAGVPACDV